MVTVNKLVERVQNRREEILPQWRQTVTSKNVRDGVTNPVLLRVDTGMRELLATGWMHNRVRMVAASFLTKNCAIPWQKGAYWFWEHLVDADLANNTLGWQWVAGCGADAVPYHRIFNPLLQNNQFDPQGEYLRRWLPELANLPPQYRHRPWLAQSQSDYPAPIIDYMQSRREALGAYQHLKKYRI